MDYVDLYLVHFPVGAKYQGEGIFKPLNADKQTDLEGRTDFVALWRVSQTQGFCFVVTRFSFSENGGASKKRAC